MRRCWPIPLPSGAVRLAVFSAVLLVLAVARPTGAQPESIEALAPGARVRVTTPDGVRTEGMLIALNDTLLVIDPDGPFRGRAEFDLRRLQQLERNPDPGRGDRAKLIGGLLGGAIGAILGARSAEGECSDSGTSWGPCFDSKDGALFGGALGAAAGGVVGWLVFGGDRWVPVALPEGLPPAGLPASSAPDSSLDSLSLSRSGWPQGDNRNR